MWRLHRLPSQAPAILQPKVERLLSAANPKAAILKNAAASLCDRIWQRGNVADVPGVVYWLDVLCGEPPQLGIEQVMQRLRISLRRRQIWAIDVSSPRDR